MGNWKACGVKKCERRAEFVVLFVPVCASHLPSLLRMKLTDERPAIAVGRAKENA